MRIVYYTRPCFLEPALSLINELSIIKDLEVHLILELSPEGWHSGHFDGIPRELGTGILPAMPVLGDFFPFGVQAYWKYTKSFNLIIHNCSKSIHPSTWLTSLKAVNFIRSLKPDILHLDDVSLRLAGALPLLGNIPIVLNVHDPEPHSGEKNWRNELARKLTFTRVKRFILHNKGLQERFCIHYQIPRNNVDIVPLGVHTIFREWIDGEVPEAERTVLFFGRLSKYKGLEILYEAAPLVAKEVPGVRFVVAGRSVRGYQIPPQPELPDGGSIEVINKYIPNTLLASLFQQATLVVCPYIDATQSGVVLTAFAFGKPVVVTKVGGLPEYVTDHKSGLLVETGNPVSLADAIVRILNDKVYNSLLKDGISLLRKNQLNWENIALQTSDIYESLIS